MTDEHLNRETQLLLKEADWTWSEMEDFVKLVQRYRSLYLTALFVSIGWVLGRVLGEGGAVGAAAGASTDVVLTKLRSRADIAAVLCIVPMLNAVFFLLMMEAAGQVQSLARYRFLLGCKLSGGSSPVWRWELWKANEGSVRAWTTPANVFMGLLAFVLTIGCFVFVRPAVIDSRFLFWLWTTSLAFVLVTVASIATAGWKMRKRNKVADPPSSTTYDTLYAAPETDAVLAPPSPIPPPPPPAVVAPRQAALRAPARTREKHGGKRQGS